MPGKTILPSTLACANKQRRQLLKLLSLTMVASLLAPGLASGADKTTSHNAKRIILITGATSGLGKRLAERLAAPGVTLLLHGRNQARAEEVLRNVHAAGATGQFYRADFASLKEVAELADRISGEHPHLDILVNNAGIYTGRAGQGRQLSEDGYELRFAVNYLSAFSLTHRLLPLLRASESARIINVSSAGQNKIDFDNLMLERDYDAQRAYGQSKLALIMFSIDLAQQLESSKITVNAIHPANYMDTAMVREAGIRPWNGVDEGADAVLQLINGAELANHSGLYFNGQRRARANSQAYDQQARARLQQLSLQLAGL